jgi:hypothetical protein
MLVCGDSDLDLWSADATKWILLIPSHFIHYSARECKDCPRS